MAKEKVENKKRPSDRNWQKIFTKYGLDNHKFEKKPFIITANQIKEATNNAEPRILCKQDTRESRPRVFQERNIFILPVKNGEYALVNGEGYVDIPEIQQSTLLYRSKLDFDLDTSKVGHSEMQYLDFAYASSLLRTFMEDDSLHLTIRGRKYTPNDGFTFRVGRHSVTATSVQTEIDAGYEGKNQVVLIEAKSSNTQNSIIRQMYYPFRQWQHHTRKKVRTLFFNKFGDTYSFWEFKFTDIEDYNSINLTRSAKYEIE
jgi:hypothetical protein